MYEVANAREDFVTGEIGEIFQRYYRGIDQGPELLTWILSVITTITITVTYNL